MSRPLSLSLYIVALTGGIGSGKSTVADLFSLRDVPVIDADVIAHNVTAPGGRAMASVLQAFGQAAVDPSGAMDRAYVRQRVFDDAASKSTLEGILHPMIRAEMDAAIERASGAAYAVLAIPLLFETMSYRDRANRSLAVDCSLAMQRQRVQNRSGLKAEQIDQIIASQVSRQIRLQLADDVICNSGAPEGLGAQVEFFHQRYVRLADEQR